MDKKEAIESGMVAFEGLSGLSPKRHCIVVGTHLCSGRWLVFFVDDHGIKGAVMLVIAIRETGPIACGTPIFTQFPPLL
ncbi:hypothetical protein SpiGrapes_1679 [Sphaerochaeta pleomorpha str. Grapes]|uniref:Uncharacterized protein n=1 Tax=Sphaerochaeta pleomorpha (strain ATCC BAA-1885 / DSM 22778 / Grapes) TaxID=158190 RepID=G8QWX7_SPHPG|nr:hypothetical protein SpiGrapes_1679 [Sphaerochaeta pleomorpha str. Grapes]